MKKTLALLLFCFVGLNGMKGDPSATALQKNLKSLKSSLTTLKIKLSDLNKKLGDLKAKLESKGTEKANPAIDEFKALVPKTLVKRINYEQKKRKTFFKDFMGIDEASFDKQKIKDQMKFEEHGGPDGKPNFKIKDSEGKIYQCGFLEQISLGDLRAQVKDKAKTLESKYKKPIVFNVIEAEQWVLWASPSAAVTSAVVDIGALQAKPENINAVFQVASNYNALETLSHTDYNNVDTIIKYHGDPTQGPKASISAVPGLVYRRYYYFYPERKNLDFKLWGQRGQENSNNNVDKDGRKLQINLLEDLPVNTMNGYVWGNADSNIENIKEENAAKFKIGYHSGIQVTFGAVHGDTQKFFYDPSQIIDQVFAAALNLGQQADLCEGADTTKAKLILEWTYEATLKSAFLKGKRDGNGKIKVFLTRMGGGVFGNNSEWIDDAIIKAVKDADLVNSGLEVTLNNYKLDSIDVNRPQLIDLVKKHNGTYILYNTITGKDIAK